MRRTVVLLALALATSSSAIAFAQPAPTPTPTPGPSPTPAPAAIPTPSTTPIAPPASAAPLLRAEAEPALVAPPEPTAPEELSARVQRFQAVVAQTTECWSARGERFEHTADRRCPEWYRDLGRGGEAAVHAIGRYLASPRTDAEAGLWLGGRWRTEPRLVALLGSTRSPVAVTYLIRALVQRAGEPRHATDAILTTLTEITGHDAAPTAPWADSPALTSRDAVVSWLDWYRRSADATRADWLVEGQRRAREALSSDDPAARFAAVRRLERSRSDRAAVTASVQGLLAMPELPASARVYVTRYAERHHIRVQPPVAVGRWWGEGSGPTARRNASARAD